MTVPLSYDATAFGSRSILVGPSMPVIMTLNEVRNNLCGYVNNFKGN